MLFDIDFFYSFTSSEMVCFHECRAYIKQIDSMVNQMNSTEVSKEMNWNQNRIINIFHTFIIVLCIEDGSSPKNWFWDDFSVCALCSLSINICFLFLFFFLLLDVYLNYSILLYIHNNFFFSLVSSTSSSISFCGEKFIWFYFILL